LHPVPADDVSGGSFLRFESVREPPINSPQALAQHLLREAEQLRRVAAASDDAMIRDELTDLVGRCAAGAAALLIHASGHWDKGTSHIFDR
jgi:hypothetical protein